ETALARFCLGRRALRARVGNARFREAFPHALVVRTDLVDRDAFGHSRIVAAICSSALVKIVVTRPVAAEALAMLRPRADVVVGPDDPPIPTADEVARLIGDADVVYTLPRTPLDAAAMRAPKRRRLLATMGRGSGA